LGLNFTTLETCFLGEEGTKLEYELGQKTNSLDPQHEFVPWILFNGKYDRKEMSRAQDNLLPVLCEHLDDPKPDACNSIF